MRINVAYPSSALLSRVLSTPKDTTEPVQDRAAPRFAEAMDAALAGQMAVSAMTPLRARLPSRAPDKKDPRERHQNDERASDERNRERAQGQRRNDALWA